MNPFSTTDFWAIVFAYTVTFASIHLLRDLAVDFGWVDKPDRRKRHRRPIPHTGGAAILLGLSAGALVHPWPPDAIGVVIGLFMIFLVSAIDDRKPIRPLFRFLTHLLAALIAVAPNGPIIDTLENCLVPGTLSLGVLAIPFTVIVVTGIVNAFNMSDGIDGLCGSYTASALIWLLLTGTALAIQGSVEMADTLGGIALPLLVSVLCFLQFNIRVGSRRRASCFLGDAGSMSLGFLTAWLLIYFVVSFGDNGLSPAAAAWMILLPVADMAACMVRRVLTGKSPMTSDRRHLHDLLQNAGLSVKQTAIALLVTSLTLGGIGVAGWLAGVPDYLSMWLLISTTVSYIVFAHLYWRRQERKQTARDYYDAVDAPRI